VGKEGQSAPRCYRVGKFSANEVKPEAKYTIFNEKITFLFEPWLSCTPFLMKNTCHQQIFPRICWAHVFLLKYSANSSPSPSPQIFLEKLPLTRALLTGISSLYKKKNRLNSKLQVIICRFLLHGPLPPLSNLGPFYRSACMKRKCRKGPKVSFLCSVRDLMFSYMMSLDVKSWLANKGITIEGFLPIVLREFVREVCFGGK